MQTATKPKKRELKARRDEQKFCAGFGKYMIELASDPDWDDGLRKPWTPMRYVSQGEIDILRERRKAWVHKHHPGTWLASTYEGEGGRTAAVPIVRYSSEYGANDGEISEPGFYRVDPIDDERDWFCRYYSGGMPWHHSSWFYQDYMRHRHKMYEDAWPRRSEGLRRKWKKDQRRLDMARREEEIKASKTRRDSAQFFRTLAMAGAIGARG